jgi:BirA family biotin operon repressor/biotin-[acetyl-CoA-carboxylase] ligase
MTLDPRSTADPVTPEAIRSGYSPRCFGREILFFDRLESTNKTLKEAAARGAPEGTMVLAEEQTAGRGRLNRTWESLSGVGVYLSVLLRPRPPIPPMFIYTFLPAVAATRALRAVSGLPVFIQWPNDVMLRGRKLAGILAEARSVEGQLREVIVGVGMNINHTPADLPASIRETATSLAIATGRAFSRAAVVRAFLKEMERGYAAVGAGQSTAILEIWRKLSPSQYGKPVVLLGGAEGETRGTTRGIDDQGALLVERRDGGLERIAFGEVRRVRPG